jgi:hypothetical protein
VQLQHCTRRKQVSSTEVSRSIPGESCFGYGLNLHGQRHVVQAHSMDAVGRGHKARDTVARRSSGVGRVHRLYSFGKKRRSRLVRCDGSDV